MSDTPLARTWAVTIDGVLYVSKGGKFVEADENEAVASDVAQDIAALTHEDYAIDGEVHQ